MCPCANYGITSCNHAQWLLVFYGDFPMFAEEDLSVTRIRVSKETIARNVAEGTHIPAVYVKHAHTGEVEWCHEAVWDGPSRCVHSKNHVWIETVAPVTTIIQDAPLAVAL